MFAYKSSTYEKMEKQPKDKKFKQNSYEEIRKLVEDNEGNDVVKEVKNKKKNNKEMSCILNYLIKYLKVFNQIIFTYFL